MTPPVGVRRAERAADGGVVGFTRGVSPHLEHHHYIHDRVSGASQMPSLADLIAERAKVLNLGPSWDTL